MHVDDIFEQFSLNFQGLLKLLQSSLSFDITIILDIFVTKVMEEPPFQLIVL